VQGSGQRAQAPLSARADNTQAQQPTQAAPCCDRDRRPAPAGPGGPPARAQRCPEVQYCLQRAGERLRGARRRRREQAGAARAVDRSLVRPARLCHIPRGLPHAARPMSGVALQVPLPMAALEADSSRARCYVDR
jgi:hypothetical protein